jgi:hypothetical protein
MQKCFAEPLEEWAEAEKQKMGRRICQLIALAKWYLWYGPNMKGQDDPKDNKSGSKVRWPGWEAALREIRDALENIHTDEVWIDGQFGNVQTSEPEGFWDDNPDFDEEDENSEEKIWQEPCWEDYYHATDREVRQALLGELAEYL